MDPWIYGHTLEKPFLQADFHFRPRRLSEKPRLRQGLLQNNSSGSEPSPRGSGGTRPRNLGACWRAGGRGAGEGSGGGAAPLRPASERASERASVRAQRGPAGGRAAAEDAEGRRRGPDSAGAAGRAPPEGVGRPRGRARAEPRALRSVRCLAPSLARSLAPSFRGGGGSTRRRRRPGSRHGGRPEPGVDLLAAALLDVRDHQGRPGLLHQVSGRAGEVARGGCGAAGASGPGDPVGRPSRRSAPVPSLPCSEEAKSTTWLHPVTGEAVVTGHRRQSTGRASRGCGSGPPGGGWRCSGLRASESRGAFLLCLFISTWRRRPLPAPRSPSLPQRPPRAADAPLARIIPISAPGTL